KRLRKQIGLCRLSLRHRFYQQSGRGQFGNLDQIVMAESAPAYVEHRGNPAQIQVPLFDWQDKKRTPVGEVPQGSGPGKNSMEIRPGGRKRRTANSGSLLK